MRQVNIQVISSSTPYLSVNSSPISATNLFAISAQIVSSLSQLAAKTFASTDVNTSTNRITITSHGLSTGVKGQFTTDGSLPTGISAVTDYYIIKIDANVVKVATSAANALAGTAVTLSAQGSGNDTFTPSTGTSTVKLQASNDAPFQSGGSVPITPSNWTDVASATVTISASGTLLIPKTDVCYEWIRLVLTSGGGMSGTILTTLKVLGA